MVRYMLCMHVGMVTDHVKKKKKNVFVKGPPILHRVKPDIVFV